MPRWRNGRRSGLKIRRGRPHGGSSPPLGTIIIALALDFIFGDPAWKWHPVRVLGNLATRIEPLCRALPFRARVQGVIFLSLTLTIYLMPIIFILFAAANSNFVFIISAGIMIYFALGGTCLAREVSDVAYALRQDGIEAGRRCVAMLVSRDACSMGESGVISSAIETLAENFSDSACATLFYAALGGPVFAWLHRITNTLDAMVGYKTPEYKDFGWASAKFDDILNFLPARISALITALAAPSVKGSVRMTLDVVRMYGAALSSPNSGYPIAAFAGALRITLCGPVSYSGAITEKPFIGSGSRPDLIHLMSAIHLYWNAYALMSILALLFVGVMNL